MSADIPPTALTTGRATPLDGDLADIATLAPVRTIRRRWPAILSNVLTLAMVVMLARELFGSGLAGLTRAVPGSPWFYVFFALLYLSVPVGDYVIFRRLWRLPAEGFVALLKKRIANEVVVGYAGEAYFYAWARQREAMVASPFGAVKDVSLLSTIASNVSTILLCALALPLGYQLMPQGVLHAIMASLGVAVVISVALLVFSKRVFSLERRTLWWVFAIHCLRIVVSSGLVALAWHFAMPNVSVGMWLFLAAGRLLVSRLPLIPNKDLLFASFAILLIGQDRALTELIAFTSALALALHGALILMFGATALLKGDRPWRM